MAGKEQNAAAGPIIGTALGGGTCGALGPTAAPSRPTPTPAHPSASPRTGESIVGPARRHSIRAPQSLAVHLCLRAQRGGTILSDRRNPVVPIRPAALRERRGARRTAQ